MINYCVLFVAFLSVLLVQADYDSGNMPPKNNSELPQAPNIGTSKSVATNCACTHVLTFDDIPNAGNVHTNPIPNGYGGLNWANATYLNTTWEKVTYGWNGYATGLTSGIFVALNSFSKQLSITTPVAGQYFQLNSMVLAAAWNNNLVVTIKGLRSNVLIYETVVTLQVTSKTIVNTKWSEIDKVTFDSAGGTRFANLSGIGTNFVLDNLEVAF